MICKDLRVKTDTTHSTSTADSGAECPQMSLFTKAYIAADKYCMVECQNHIMDYFWSRLVTNKPCSSLIAELTDRGPEKSPLRRYMLLQLADHTLAEEDLLGAHGSDSDAEKIAGRGNPDAGDFLRATWQIHQWKRRDLRQREKIKITKLDYPGKESDWHTPERSKSFDQIDTESDFLDVLGVFDP